MQQALVVASPELGPLVGHAEQVGVQLWEGRGMGSSGLARPGHTAAPSPPGPWGGPTCSRCRTLLARRSNTTSVWSSLPEMMCWSSASSASTALECSRRLFSRAGPTSWAMGQEGEGHQSPLEAPSPPEYPRPLSSLEKPLVSSQAPILQVTLSLPSCPSLPVSPGLGPPISCPISSLHPICSQHQPEDLGTSQHKRPPPAGHAPTPSIPAPLVKTRTNK